MEDGIKHVNKGTGAGGKNTNITGKAFEKITDMQDWLIKRNFKVVNNEFCTSSFLEYIDKKISIQHFTQYSFQQYILKKFNIHFDFLPDCAFIITDKKSNIINIRILEKKTQNGEGSVDTKLFGAPTLKKIYQEKYFGDKFNVNYAYIVNDYYKDKFNSATKFMYLKEEFDNADIRIFYSSDENYFDAIYKWLLE